MRTGRRQFIAGLLATGVVPKPTWADAGSPSFLSAAASPDGTYVLCGIDADLNISFRLIVLKKSLFLTFCVELLR